MPRIYKTYKCKLCEATFKGQHSEVMYKIREHLVKEHNDIYITIEKQSEAHYRELQQAIQQAEIRLAIKYPLHEYKSQFDFVPSKS